MFVIRSAKPSDYKAIYRLAGYLNSYNLPQQPAALRRMLASSQRAFSSHSRSENAIYLFVAEEVATGKIAGCSLIIARHGTPALPHLSFLLGYESKRSRTTGKTVEHHTLKLQKDSKGFTEIGGLVVLPEFRRSPAKLGKQLSYARFAYMAAFPHKFQKRVIVEYLPKLDHETGNRLWSSLGQRFTELNYKTADHLSARNKEFILSLFPREKIYCCLLPESAVVNLGVPGPGAERSLKMLQRLGFKFLHSIDPFDGGPHYGAATSRIVPIKNSVRLSRRKGKIDSRVRSVMLLSAERSGVRAEVIEVSDLSRKIRSGSGKPLVAVPFGN